MPQISFTISEGTLMVSGQPEVVCDNADYTASISGLPPGTSVLAYTVEIDGENVTGEIELDDGEADLPAFPESYGVWVRIRTTQDDAVSETNAVWIPCKASVKARGTQAYSAPYDVYNAMMQIATGRNTMTPEELETVLTLLHDRLENPPAWPGTAYKRAIASTVRETRLTGTLKLTDDTEISITDESIVESTLSISTTATNDDYLLPGGVPSKEAAVTLRGGVPQELLRGSELSPTFRLRLESGRWFDVPLGVFTVMTAGDDTTRGIPIVAYDDMRKLDRVAPAECGFAEKVSYSPNQIITKICNAAGVDYTQNVDFDDRFTGVSTHSVVYASLGVTDAWGWAIVISNADGIDDIQAELNRLYYGMITYIGDREYPSDLPDDAELWVAYKVAYNGPTYYAAKVNASVETARDLLMHTMRTVNGIAEIAPDRQMRIKPIEEAHDAEQISENRTHRRAVSCLDYKLSSLSIPFTIRGADGTRTIVPHTEETLWPDYYVAAQADENALWTVIAHEDESAQAAQQREMNHLVDRLDPVVYRPGRVDMYGDPTIGLLDWITTDGTRMMPVTASVWRYRGQQQITACGSDAVAKAATSQLDKRLSGNDIEQAKESQNMMRVIYGTFMQTYRGMGSFKYTDIEHYTHRELGGGTIT